MSEPLFNITFYGIIQPEKDRETVIENMATLFKTTPEKVRPFFAGGRKIIKSSVDELTAQKYRVALENVGLVIKLETVAIEAASQNTEVAESDEGDFSVAPVGADVLENPPAVEPQPVADISDFTLADLGADVLDNPPVVDPQPIDDISAITLAEVGADVLENPPVVDPQPIDDISALSLAEAGADIIENPEPKAKAPIPDTSGLSVDGE
ncbi:MAG: hypothetical protein WBO93_17720 [Gammaproteobacteria bacterium]